MDVKYNFFLFQFTTQFLFSPKQEEYFRETSFYHHTTRPCFPNCYSVSSSLYASTNTNIHVIQVILNMGIGIEMISSLPDP